MRNTKNERGVTLVELMIALGLVSIVMVFVYSFFLQQRAVLKRQRSLAEVSQYSLTSVDVISRTLVNAGFDVKRGTGLEAASDRYVVMVADMNGNGVIVPSEVIAFGASKISDPTTGTETVQDCDNTVVPAAKNCAATPLHFSFYADTNADGIVAENESVTLANFKLNLAGPPPYTLYRYRVNDAANGIATPDAVENNLEYVWIKYVDANGYYLPYSQRPAGQVCTPPLVTTDCKKPALPPYVLRKDERRLVRKIDIQFMTRALSKDINVTSKNLAAYKDSGNYPVGTIATYNTSGTVSPVLNAGFSNDGYMRRTYNVEVTPRNFVTDICGRVLMSLQMLEAPCEWDTSLSPDGPKRHIITAKITDLYGDPKLNTTITFNISSKWGDFANPNDVAYTGRITETQVSSGSTGTANVAVYHWKVPPAVTDRSQILDFRAPFDVTVNGSFVDAVNFNPACTAASSINAPFVPGPPVRVAFVNPDPSGFGQYHLPDPDADGYYPVDLNNDGVTEEQRLINPDVEEMYPALSNSLITVPFMGTSTLATCGATDDNGIATLGVEIQDICGNPTKLAYGGSKYRLRLLSLAATGGGTPGTIAPTNPLGKIRPFVDDATGYHVLPQDNNNKLVIIDPTDTYVPPDSTVTVARYNGDSPLVISYKSSPNSADYPTSRKQITTLSQLYLFPTFFGIPQQIISGGGGVVGKYVAGIFLDMSVADLNPGASSIVAIMRAAPATYSSLAQPNYYNFLFPAFILEPKPAKIVWTDTGDPNHISIATANSMESSYRTANNDNFIDLKACAQGPVKLDSSLWGIQDACDISIDPTAVSPGTEVRLSLTSTDDPGILSDTVLTLPTDPLEINYTSPLTFTAYSNPTIHMTIWRDGAQISSEFTWTPFGINYCERECVITTSDYFDTGFNIPTSFNGIPQCVPSKVMKNKVAGVVGSNQITLQTAITDVAPSSLVGRNVLFDQSMRTYVVASATSTSVTVSGTLDPGDTQTGDVFEIFDPVCFNVTTILERQGTPLTSFVGSTTMLTPCTANVWVNFGGCAGTGLYNTVEMVLEPTDMSGAVARNASSQVMLPNLGNIFYSSGGNAAPTETRDDCLWNGDTSLTTPNNYDNVYNLQGVPCFKIPVDIGDASGFTDAFGNLITTNIGVRAYFPRKFGSPAFACNPDVTCDPSRFAKCTGTGSTCYRPGAIKVTSECRQISACVNNANCNSLSSPPEIIDPPNSVTFAPSITLNSCSATLTFKVYDCNRNKNKTTSETIAASAFNIDLMEGGTATDHETRVLTESAATAISASTITVVDTNADTIPDTSVNSPLFTGTISVDMSANTVGAINNGKLNIPYGHSAELRAHYVDPNDPNDNRCDLHTLVNWSVPFCIYGCMNGFNCAYPSTTMVMATSANNLVLKTHSCSMNTNATTSQSGLVMVQMSGLTTKEVEIVTVNEVAGTWTVPVDTLAGTYPAFTSSTNSPIFAGLIPVIMSGDIRSNNGRIDIAAGATSVGGQAFPVTVFGSYSILSKQTVPSRITVTGSPWTTSQLVGAYVYIPTAGNLYIVTANTNNQLTLSTWTEFTTFANVPTGTGFAIYQRDSSCMTFYFTIYSNATPIYQDNYQSYAAPATVCPAGYVCSGTTNVANSSVTSGDKEMSLGRTAGTASFYRIISTAGKSNIIISGHLGAYGNTGLVSAGTVRYTCNNGGTWTTFYTRTATTAAGTCYGDVTDTAPNSTCAPFTWAAPACADNNTQFGIMIAQTTTASGGAKGRFDDLVVWGF